MAQRKTYLLRLDPEIHEAVQRWADAELRSMNAQIEFVLRNALRQSGRLRAHDDSPVSAAEAQPKEDSQE